MGTSAYSLRTVAEELIPELSGPDKLTSRIRRSVSAFGDRIWNQVLNTTPKRVAAVVAIALLATVLAIVLRPRTIIEPTGEAVGSRISMPTTAPPPTTNKPKPPPTAKPTTTTALPVTVPATVPVVTVEPDPIPVTNEQDGSLGNPVQDTGPEAWPGGCCAPLTGMGYDDPSFANRAALAVKINNSPEADPHSGLYRADMIYELRVEGVSRFIAVFHSRAVDVIGPIRSGRTSDPPILHALGRPLVAYSGGNSTVYEVFGNAEANGWLVNVATRWAPTAYFRTKERVLPHNYYAHSDVLWNARGGATVPLPQFDFLPAGATNPTAVQGTIVKTRVSSVNSEFVWDAGSGMYLRSQRGRPHLDLQTGHRIARSSVIVLQTSYGTSGADARSPEAITTWAGGEAWVFTGGTYVHGRWGRQDTDKRFSILDDNEQPIKLVPGPVWIAMTDVPPTFG